MIKLFIQKEVLTVSLNLLILFLGFFTLPYISNEFIPSIEIPAVAVVIPAPLIDQERQVREIILPLEKQLKSDGSLENLEVRMMDSKIVFVLYYSWNLEASEALRKARVSFSKIALPVEALAPIFVLHRPSNSPVLRTVIYGKEITEVSRRGRELKSIIERIPGVSEVKLQGSTEDAMGLFIDPVNLARYKINASDLVVQAKEKWNLSFFKNNLKSEPVSILFKVEKDEVGGLPVQTPVGIKSLNQLAPVSDLNRESLVTFNSGNPAIVLEIIKSPGADTVTIADEALGKIENNFKAIKDKTLNFKVVYNESEKIQESQNSLFENFAIGVVLNSLILMFFLGSGVGVLVASVVFPTTIFGTFFAMKFLGISINLFSLNGFSLAVGMITDASIVVLESIVRRVQKGEKLFEASLNGTNDVGMGVFTSTLTTAGVLLPIAMQKNLSSKLFSDLSLTVVATQIICLVAVFSLVPWLCSFTLSSSDKKNFVLSGLYKVSSSLVNRMVTYSDFIIANAVRNAKFRYGFPLLVLVISLGAISFMPDTEFLPQVSSRIYALSLPLKEKDRDQVSRKYAKSFSDTFQSSELVDWNLVQQTSDGIEVLVGYKNAMSKEAIVEQLKGREFASHEVNILPVGPAPAGESMGFHGLYFLSTKLEKEKRMMLTQALCRSKGVNYCLGREQKQLNRFSLFPRCVSMQQAGLTSIESTSQLIFPIHSIDLLSFTSFNLNTPFYLHYDEALDILNLPLEIQGNWLISLGSLYEKSLTTFDSIRMRLNGEEYYPLYFRLREGTLGKVDQDMHKIMEEKHIDSQNMLGRGQLETMNETFGSMIEALALAGLIVFSILWIQFKSFAQASVIMSTIPLTLGGAILGLVLMNESVNASVMVGFILLVGIIVNNGIFLTEGTNANLKEGMDVKEAVRLATEERTRPILMTSFATIFGMLPTLLIGGEGSELYRGMAVVNIFGMFVGTLLSLLVTPILIMYLGCREHLKREINTGAAQ